MKKFNDEFEYQFEPPKIMLEVNGNILVKTNPLWAVYHSDDKSQFDTFETEAELLQYLTEISE